MQPHWCLSAWQQHDVQELCRVMFDALECSFKNTDQVLLVFRYNVYYLFGVQRVVSWAKGSGKCLFHHVTPYWRFSHGNSQSQVSKCSCEYENQTLGSCCCGCSGRLSPMQPEFDSQLGIWSWCCTWEGLCSCLSYMYPQSLGGDVKPLT